MTPLAAFGKGLRMRDIPLSEDAVPAGHHPITCAQETVSVGPSDEISDGRTDPMHVHCAHNLEVCCFGSSVWQMLCTSYILLSATTEVTKSKAGHKSSREAPIINNPPDINMRYD